MKVLLKLGLKLNEIPQKALFIISAMVTRSSSAIYFISRQGYPPSFTNFASSPESYAGPSSYTTSFGSDYPGYGDFGSLMNVRNPQISSSYSTFGPSTGSSGFTSTSYVNYPQTTQQENSKPQSSYASSFPTQNQAWLPQSSSSSLASNQQEEGIPISQHVEITKPIVVPVYKKFPYPVAKRFPVAIPHPGRRTFDIFHLKF